MLVLHDQSIWNSIIPEITKIPNNILKNLFPKDEIKQDNARSAIIHFIGSPKPWDILGEFINPHASVWYSEAKKLNLRYTIWSKYLSITSWSRAFRIKSQYPGLLELFVLLGK
jgi:lipopolysaccharide biosynthesis glycosyltransferase